MKIALIGYGKMGHVVEDLVAGQGIEIVDRFTSTRPLAVNDVTRQKLADITALVDFSLPHAVWPTVQAAAEMSLNMVIGTTGWNERLDDVREVVESSGIGLVHGSNFSLGVNVFYRLAEQAAKIFAAVESYDPYIQDWHHRFKLDSPSGTALELQRRMASHYGEREIPISSLRAGYVPSVHTVGFDSASDTMHLEHRARNRQGFGDGALLAAKWVGGRQGLHAFSEVLSDILPAT